MQCVELGGRRIIKKIDDATHGERRALQPIGMKVFFQAEDGIRDVERSRGLGDVYKRQLRKRRRRRMYMYIPVLSSSTTLIGVETLGEELTTTAPFLVLKDR